MIKRYAIITEVEGIAQILYTEMGIKERFSRKNFIQDIKDRTGNENITVLDVKRI